MNTAYPFAEMDMTKLMANFKLPEFEYGSLVEAQKRNVATFQEAGALASKTFQAIAQRQFEMMQKGFEAALAGANQVVKADSPEASAQCHIALAQKAYETQVANLREIGEMAQQAGGEVFEIVNKRFLEGLDEFAQTTAKVAQSAPRAAKPKAAK